MHGVTVSQFAGDELARRMTVVSMRSCSIARANKPGASRLHERDSETANLNSCENLPACSATIISSQHVLECQDSGFASYSLNQLEFVLILLQSINHSNDKLLA